jgi:hypothetical protein
VQRQITPDERLREAEVSKPNGLGIFAVNAFARQPVLSSFAGTVAARLSDCNWPASLKRSGYMRGTIMLRTIFSGTVF